MEATADVPSKQLAKTATDLFKWSKFVHVGEGAETCPHATDGRCPDAGHFHAWIRLPNPYQEEEIQEKALAARARRLRQFRDPDSDPYLLMEEECYETPDEDAIAELAAEHWNKDQSEARQEIIDAADQNIYEHIDDDVERWFYLRDLGPEKRAETGVEAEFHELDRHLEEFNTAVRERFEELRLIREEALRGLTVDERRAELKRHRTEVQGTNAFFKARNLWQCVAGTYKPAGAERPTQRLLPDGEASIRELPSDILVALNKGFDDLSGALIKEGGQGNF